ncbi:hypothetical protein SSYRP_v1c08470 [Spiroplasma syrphidicola EA-1]|uniref:Lipoprotein n=1 Tax=Spiroplasma syrphidicola EA-1 TaxID=1276229 RepID=R4UMH1_9MOLU|nr:lipoprotein [Spiroplasma syrphidicola]AGM26436.1 hypothetical protein SSYRP_v1c08470 [Spiroplasma syrphidicola EA-1]
MKKLLSIIGAISLTATGASSVVACNKKKQDEPKSGAKLETAPKLKDLNKSTPNDQKLSAADNI